MFASWAKFFNHSFSPPEASDIYILFTVVPRILVTPELWLYKDGICNVMPLHVHHPPSMQEQLALKNFETNMALVYRVNMDMQRPFWCVGVMGALHSPSHEVCAKALSKWQSYTDTSPRMRNSLGVPKE